MSGIGAGRDNVILLMTLLTEVLSLCTQQTFTCSKSTIETLKKVWNMFKVNNKDTKRRQWHHSGVFNVNFEHISQHFLEFVLLLWTGKCFLGMYAFMGKNTLKKGRNRRKLHNYILQFKSGFICQHFEDWFSKSYFKTEYFCRLPDQKHCLE